MTLRERFGSDEQAVSPVIGVILMVAITVILAAVIGTMVLRMDEDLSETPQASVSTSGEEVTVTDLGNSDGVVITDDSNGVQASLTNVGDSTDIEDDHSRVIAYIGSDPSEDDNLDNMNNYGGEMAIVADDL